MSKNHRLVEKEIEKREGIQPYTSSKQQEINQDFHQLEETEVLDFTITSNNSEVNYIYKEEKE